MLYKVEMYSDVRGVLEARARQEAPNAPPYVLADAAVLDAGLVLSAQVITGARRSKGYAEWAEGQRARRAQLLEPYQE